MRFPILSCCSWCFVLPHVCCTPRPVALIPVCACPLAVLLFGVFCLHACLCVSSSQLHWSMFARTPFLSCCLRRFVWALCLYASPTLSHWSLFARASFLSCCSQHFVCTNVCVCPPPCHVDCVVHASPLPALLLAAFCFDAVFACAPHPFALIALFAHPILLSCCFWHFVSVRPPVFTLLAAFYLGVSPCCIACCICKCSVVLNWCSSSFLISFKRWAFEWAKILSCIETIVFQCMFNPGMFARILSCIEMLSYQCRFNPGMFAWSGNIPILLESYPNAQRLDTWEAGRKGKRWVFESETIFVWMPGLFPSFKHCLNDCFLYSNAKRFDERLALSVSEQVPLFINHK